MVLAQQELRATTPVRTAPRGFPYSLAATGALRGRHRRQSQCHRGSFSHKVCPVKVCIGSKATAGQNG